jgi:NDP-sugar pyrophosphorylase family protein
VEAGAAVGPDAVVGADARIGPGATVRRAVVWEGTEVRPGEAVVDAIAAGDARVPARP